MNDQQARSRLISLGLCAVLLAAFALMWGVDLSRPYALDYDEGVYLCSARMRMHGHPLFSSVFSSQPPVFLELLGFAFRLFGDTVAVGRGLMIFFSLISLAAVAWIGWRLAGATAAPVALISLGLPLVYFRQARVVQAEMPALCFALLAVGAALNFRYARRWWWLIMSGVCFALGCLCKLLVVPMIVPILFLLALATDESVVGRWRLLPTASDSLSQFARRLGVFGLAGAAVCLLTLSQYDFSSAYRQIVGFHVEMKKYFLPGRSQNMELLYQLLVTEIGVTLLVVAGLITLFWKNTVAAAWLCLWILATGIFLIDHSPLYVHHLVLFIPPLAVAASAGAHLVATVWHKRSGKLLTLIFILPLISYGHSSGIEWSLKRDLQSLSPTARDEIQEEQAVALIKAHTRPTDFVVSDQQMQVFRAGRMTPPPLCDTSYARVRSGFLTDAQAINASADARIIIFWSNRLGHLTHYRQWVRSNFRLLKKFDGPRGSLKEVYLRD